MPGLYKTRHKEKGIQSRRDLSGRDLQGWIGQGQDSSEREMVFVRPLTEPGHVGVNGNTFLEKSMEGMTDPKRRGNPSELCWECQVLLRGGEREQWNSMLANSFSFLKIRCPSECFGG